MRIKLIGYTAMTCVMLGALFMCEGMIAIGLLSMAIGIAIVLWKGGEK